MSRPAPMSLQAQQWLSIAPIFNFSSALDTFNLGELEVRRLTPVENEKITDVARQMSFTLFAEMTATEFGITGSESRTEPAAFQLDERFRSVITTLRLVKSGAAYVNLIYSWPADDPGRSSLRTQSLPIMAGKGYYLERSELPLLSQLFAALPSATKAKKGLGRAIQRFDLAYQRVQPEDKLIDFWIALEGMFLTEGNTGELRFRSALRMAHYVGGSPEERWDIYRNMKRSYDLRSLVVHGERVKKEEVNTAATGTEEVLRRALRTVILDPKSLNPQTLDRQAVEGVRQGRAA